MRYPFLFRKDEKDISKFYVKIAEPFDYVYYKSGWMDDSELGKTCLIPDVDICVEKHVFDSEEDAIEFIREWWSKN